MPPKHAFAADLRATFCPLDELRMAKLPCQSSSFCMNLQGTLVAHTANVFLFQASHVDSGNLFPTHLSEIVPDINSDTLDLVIEGLGHQTKPPSQNMVNSVRAYEPKGNTREYLTC